MDVEWVAYRRHGEISANLHAKPIAAVRMAALCGTGASAQSVVVRPGAIERPRCHRCEMALVRNSLAEQGVQ